MCIFLSLEDIDSLGTDVATVTWMLIRVCGYLLWKISSLLECGVCCEMIDEAVVNLAIGKGRLSLMLLRKLNVSAELC
jgi:hypothetical protein